MKKRTLIISLSILGVLLLAGAGAGAAFALLNKHSSPDSNHIVDTGPNFPHIEPEPSIPFNEDKTTAINNIGNVKSRITEYERRNVNHSFYDTELLKQYGKLGFKYPGWDNNYETMSADELTLNHQLSEPMNILVYNERTNFDIVNGNNTKKAKYSDPEFIIDEIKNNRLKKHPAASNFYKNNVTDDTLAVTKEFSIPSGCSGVTSLGLYAPAGEVIEITFSQETIDSMKQQNINNFEIWINSSYYDINENDEMNNGSGKTSNRYPFVKTRFVIKTQDIDVNNTYQFGTPFGGTISCYVNTGINSSTSNTIYRSYQNYEFEIKNAVETISFINGVTTKNEWLSQIDRYYQLDEKFKITAPAIALDFAYGSMYIAANSSKDNTFANTPINKIVFPQDTLDKWTDFLFISEYYASRDVNKNVRKLDFEFCDDIWGNASAWGGGNALYSPLSWASNSFLQGAEQWTITNNWGTFHEINHNFQQDSAFWITNTHGETNQVTIGSLALLGDVGRWRNIYNETSEYTRKPSSWGWQKLQNQYAVLKYLSDLRANNRTCDEYQIYAIFCYLLGAYNYINYVRHDIATDNGNDPIDGTKREGGFYEILELSNYFELNFWPALEDYYSLWHDDKSNWSPFHKWPASYNNATDEQKIEIDKLNQYKSFDFVGNIYACGSYLWNQQLNDYIYTDDVQAVFQIPAGRNYVFDFEQGINWINPDFAWDQISFPSTTALGAQLIQDPTNPKKLIYIPNKDKMDEIDEFDISITPNFTNMPTNYVDQYKWKIKVRQVVNAPLETIYDGWNNQYNFNAMVQDMRNVNNGLPPVTLPLTPKFSTIHDVNIGNGVFLDNWNDFVGLSSSYYFIAPYDGTYNFEFKSNHDIAIDINNETVYSAKGQQRDWRDVGKTYTLKKGDKLKFDIYLITRGAPIFNMQVVFDKNNNGGEILDLMKNVVVPYADELTSNYSDLLDQKYQYQHRKVDYNKFQTNMFGLNVSRPIAPNYNNDLYTFNSISPIVNNIDNLLKNQDNRRYEIWGENQPTEYQPVEGEIEINFNQPTVVGSLRFDFVQNNMRPGRPQQIKIWNENNELIYAGTFGSQFNDRMNEHSFISFDKKYTVSKLKIWMRNEEPTNGNTKRVGICIDSIFVNKECYYQANRVIPIQHPSINYSNDQWEFINNSTGENISAINQTSVKTDVINASLELQIYASGFDIVGLKPQGKLMFDVYVNDELYLVSYNSHEQLFNQILFSYNASNGGEMINIRIVNRSSNPLYINYFQTYGKEVKTIG